MIKFIVKNRKTLAEQSYELKKNVVVVGRSRQCDIILDSETVSRQHCQFHVGKDEIFFEDLGSGNGSIINNKPAPSKQRVPIKADDIIRVEDFDIYWQPDKALPKFESDSPMNSTDPDILEMKMIKKVIGAMSTSKKPQIIILSEPFQNQTLTLDDQDKTYCVGRDPECDLSLNSPVLSRKHAEVLCKWGSFVLKDLQSKNGTFVNGQRITQETSLKDKDQITFGTIQAAFHCPDVFNFSEIESSLQKDKPKKPEDSQSFSAVPTPNTSSQKTDPTKLKSQPEEPKAIQPAPEKPAEDSKPAPEEPKPTPPKKAKTPGIFSDLSGTEKALLAFAVLVIGLVVFALVNLFG